MLFIKKSPVLGLNVDTTGKITYLEHKKRAYRETGSFL
jgi:hypothetical protein